MGDISWMCRGNSSEPVVLGSVKEMSKSAARRKLKETIAETGINSPSYRIPSTDTFARQVEQWMGTTVAKCKVSTRKLRRYHTDVYLLPKWGKSAVECITPKVVNEWLIAPELKHLSRETMKGIISTLQAALGRRFPRRSILYPSQMEVEDDPRCFTAEEVERIVDAAKGQQYKVLFKLAAETGARAGELYALTAGDVLFAHNVVRVNKSMYDQQVGSPKSRNASRWINVKPYVMQMLNEHLKGRTEGLVFQSRRRTPLQNCTALHKHLHRLLRQLSIEQGGMHAFRHHRVSTLVMAGTPLAVIKKWIGHGSEQMVERYTHLRPDFMRDELARVPNFAPKAGEIDPFDPKEAAVA